MADSAAALSHVHRKLEKAYQHECMSYERVKKINIKKDTRRVQGTWRGDEWALCLRSFPDTFSSTSSLSLMDEWKIDNFSTH